MNINILLRELKNSYLNGTYSVMLGLWNQIEGASFLSSSNLEKEWSKNK